MERPSRARARRPLRNWSDYNPGHLPITVQIDLKTLDPYGWGDGQYDELHAQVAEVLGSKLYRPDDLRMFAGASN